MQVADDARRIEQDDQVLGKVGQRVHLQLLLAEPDRARLGDAKCRADDADIDIGQLGRVRANVERPSPAHLRGG